MNNDDLRPIVKSPSVSKHRELCLSLDKHGIIGIQIIQLTRVFAQDQYDTLCWFQPAQPVFYPFRKSRPEAVHAVKNQVGVQPSVLIGEPDLTICYVDRIKAPMNHLVMGRTGFIEYEFCIVTG